MNEKVYGILEIVVHTLDRIWQPLKNLLLCSFQRLTMLFFQRELGIAYIFILMLMQFFSVFYTSYLSEGFKRYLTINR